MDIRKLIQDKERLENELSQSQRDIERLQNSCCHDWEYGYDPVYKEGYTIRGEESHGIHMGHPPIYVPPTTTKRWVRTCKKCLKKEYTDRTTKQTTESPVW